MQLPQQPQYYGQQAPRPQSYTASRVSVSSSGAADVNVTVVQRFM